MESEKIISIIDPFFERPTLVDKSNAELTSIFEKLNDSLYSYSHNDYAPEKIIPLLSKKFRELKRREDELNLREKNIKQRESEMGISSSRKKKSLPFYDAPTFATPKHTPLRSTKNEHQKAKRDDDYVRSPDKPVRMRLIDDDDEDEEMRMALNNSREQYRVEQMRRALIESQNEELRREEESYRAKIERDRIALEEEKRERERQEKDILASRRLQEDEDNAIAQSLKSAPKEYIDDEDDIKIDMSRFTDKPSDISEDFLKEICLLLKKQEFENARKKMQELSAGSIAWFIRLKCGNGTLKGKIVSRDAEAYKCILCRDTN